MSSLSINDLSGGGKAWSPAEIGDKISGQITNVERRQQTAFDDSSKLLTWDDGSPRLQTVITLQTDLRDPAVEDDDGVRTVYLKGGRNFEVAEGTGQSGEAALVDAVKKADATSVDEGATLTVVFSGRAKPTTRGFQPAKMFAMKYAPPKASVAVSDLFGDD